MKCTKNELTDRLRSPEHSKLFVQLQLIPSLPDFRDLAVGEAEDQDSHQVDRFSRRGKIRQIAGVLRHRATTLSSAAMMSSMVARFFGNAD